MPRNAAEPTNEERLRLLRQKNQRLKKDLAESEELILDLKHQFEQTQAALNTLKTELQDARAQEHTQRQSPPKKPTKMILIDSDSDDPDDSNDSDDSVVDPTRYDPEPKTERSAKKRKLES
ncbi:hypothetical protein BS47DRAFT_1215450 [Hydnum rufescens UP504]|uniref:Uncharacterized protein n=1 Tax=Hydnum rufescens UP504 TaxID=1448309 RepID=A0A9P6ASB7_9AGAM|nr:hypothetical protein BS47DRAFT_1215450 [Hydnum rufescens UP504]